MGFLALLLHHPGNVLPPPRESQDAAARAGAVPGAARALWSPGGTRTQQAVTECLFVAQTFDETGDFEARINLSFLLLPGN